MFYVFCGDNALKWKVSISVYFAGLIIIGVIIGYILGRRKERLISYTFIILAIFLTIFNLFRIIRFVFWDIY